MPGGVSYSYVTRLLSIIAAEYQRVARCRSRYRVEKIAIFTRPFAEILRRTMVQPLAIKMKCTTSSHSAALMASLPS
jgi:hypothetical protein